MSKQSAEDRILNGQLWNDFCDRLKAAGQLLQEPNVPKDRMNQALGHRFLTRILRAGLERVVDYADPQYPAFYRLADDTKKILNDNPDNYYENCNIDGRFDYRISGTRGTVKWFSIGIKGGVGVEGMASLSEIDSSKIELEPDGSFEILLSQKKPQKGNWLELSPKATNLVVRQTFGNRKQEKRAELSIECLNPERKNNNVDPDRIEAQLMGALGFLESTVKLGLMWTKDYQENTLNRLHPHDQAVLQAAGGDPTIHYYQSHWQLAPDEALAVRIPFLPECQTWNLQLSNFWMESLDHRFFNVWTNKFMARHEPDGSVKILIAHADPGPAHPNWLNTLGHDQGGMLGRIVGAAGPCPKEWETQVVKFADVASR
ncbi:MAG: DUF1214 domain-containing protein [Myxococcota bacterium]